ncbi:Lrp/AsnC family transcriptional regulator [Candidatus Woesearchaeota archaeon]|nr:Lrp/AsnC family transcriptional regulator [Candidatus Woesearchaeota archaeon]
MLQKNERLVLKHLIEHARASDSSISEKVGITTQAVGKIRRKLEEQGVIMGYGLLLNHNALGISLFTEARLQLPPELLDSKEYRKEVFDDPCITACMRQVHGEAHLHVIYAFKNINESNTYFLKLTTKHPGIKIIDIQPTTWDLVWKLNRTDAFKRALEEE